MDTAWEEIVRKADEQQNWECLDENDFVLIDARSESNGFLQTPTVGRTQAAMDTGCYASAFRAHYEVWKAMKMENTSTVFLLNSGVQAEKIMTMNRRHTGYRLSELHTVSSLNYSRSWITGLIALRLGHNVFSSETDHVAECAELTMALDSRAPVALHMDGPEVLPLIDDEKRSALLMSACVFDDATGKLAGRMLSKAKMASAVDTFANELPIVFALLGSHIDDGGEMKKARAYLGERARKKESVEEGDEYPVRPPKGGKPVALSELDELMTFMRVLKPDSGFAPKTAELIIRRMESKSDCLQRAVSYLTRSDRHAKTPADYVKGIIDGSVDDDASREHFLAALIYRHGVQELLWQSHLDFDDIGWPDCNDRKAIADLIACTKTDKAKFEKGLDNLQAKLHCHVGQARDVYWALLCMVRSKFGFISPWVRQVLGKERSILVNVFQDGAHSTPSVAPLDSSLLDTFVRLRARAYYVLLATKPEHVGNASFTVAEWQCVLDEATGLGYQLRRVRVLLDKGVGYMPEPAGATLSGLFGLSRIEGEHNQLTAMDKMFRHTTRCPNVKMSPLPKEWLYLAVVLRNLTLGAIANEKLDGPMPLYSLRYIEAFLRHAFRVRRLMQHYHDEYRREDTTDLPSEAIGATNPIDQRPSALSISMMQSVVHGLETVLFCDDVCGTVLRNPYERDANMPWMYLDSMTLNDELLGLSCQKPTELAGDERKDYDLIMAFILQGLDEDAVRKTVGLLDVYALPA